MSDDFLDELPTSVPAGARPKPAPRTDDDMDQVVKTAAPAKKTVTRTVKRLVRKGTTLPAPAGTMKLPRTGLPVTKPATLPPPPPSAEDAEAASSPPQYDPLASAEEDAATAADVPTSVEELPDDVTAASDASEELQTLPLPSRVVPRPATKPQATAATLPIAVAAVPPTNVNKRWDEFLMSLEPATLVAVYELNIMSITEFTTYALADLMKPRGRLTEAQAKEVQQKLAAMGVELSTVSHRGATMRHGGQTRVRGYRAPLKTVPALPADATAQQRRQYRMARNRLTM